MIAVKRRGPPARVRLLPDQVVPEQARAVHGVHDDQPGAVPLRVGEGDGDRDGVVVDALDPEHHRPVGGNDGHAADDGHGAPRGRAHGQRRRVQADVLVPLAAAHGDHQELGVRGCVGQRRRRVPGDAGAGDLHVGRGLLGRRPGQVDDRLDPPLGRRPAVRGGRHVDDPQRCAAAVRLLGRPTHGLQGDAGPVHTHDHGRWRRTLLVHPSLLFVAGSGLIERIRSPLACGAAPRGRLGTAQGGPFVRAVPGPKVRDCGGLGRDRAGLREAAAKCPLTAGPPAVSPGR